MITRILCLMFAAANTILCGVNLALALTLLSYPHLFVGLLNGCTAYYMYTVAE